MPAGTLTLANNSVIVKGTGTAFSTELKPGDMVVSVVGGVTYTLPVKTVDSATQVTLIKAYDGPTQAGASWHAVPRDAMNAITAQLAAETAKALRGLNLDKENWQQVFSGNGNIAVKLPDGSTYTGPAWNSFTAALNQKADKTSLGTAAGATLQNHVADKVAGRVLTVGGFGLGVGVRAQPLSWEEHNSNFSWFYTTEQAGGYAGAGHEAKISIPTNDGVNDFIATLYANRQTSRIGMSMKQVVEGGSQVNREVWRGEFRTTLNTAVDGNGFIKQASPIARISDDPKSMADNYLDGFELAGLAAVNQEAAGVSAKKIETGIYLVSGAFGLAREGWDFEVPQDSNGNRLCFVEVMVNNDGEIELKVSKRRLDINTASIIAGEPMDIPKGRWIDLRLEMPN
ncbi:phage tail fiber protein [Serratia entomophila]|uniref:phage tail fiber protein n=1 Tax=Serratia entomophila TaxID=42906 RepID=UPI00217C8926|nr:hypothetical protein [Serratia entomophila]CAI1123562.1 Uncharacterised protein [Serratia entomophila]CAI1851573.1 Uncharacterised protein [Serratia entomophila]CAI1856103.1 Uncharacterised protein [Serratia entomophila]CAI1922603.1 Uncharacterised protein [Serratia entomophila]CAI1953372.1 Uncharacterised protein [Serratia entomophila]